MRTSAISAKTIQGQSGDGGMPVEDDDLESDRGGQAAAFASDSGATAIALNAGAKLDARAAAFLAKQGELVDLQIADLKREDRVRHWSLRVRHISDVLKLAFELSIVLVVLAFVTWIGVSFWNAAHDNDLVIEPLSVPPDFAQRGLTGEVLAGDITDRVNAVAARVPYQWIVTGSFKPDAGNDIKVQIPDTGISIGQFYAYLVRVLGHQRHISGAVYRSSNGLVLKLRLDGEPARTFSGNEDGFETIEQQAAWSLVEQTQPSNYVLILWDENRKAEALESARRAAARGSPWERAQMFASWAYLLQFAGNLREVEEKERAANNIDPEHVAGLQMLYGTEADLGHDEASLPDARADIRAIQQGKFANLVPSVMAMQGIQAKEWLAEQSGDLQSALSDATDGIREVRENQGDAFDFFVPLAAQILAAQHDVTRSRAVFAQMPGEGDAAIASSTLAGDATVPPFPQLYQDMALDDWHTALVHMRSTYAAATAPGSPTSGYLATYYDPWFALTKAKTGDLAGAENLIARTPFDCLLCLRVRARIAAEKKDWRGASFWFARAVAAAPSIPFSFTDWGATLLRRGDYDGAIGEFVLANRKGPHFADPLELWGEALMQENRSDLALAKFEEANKYAPNWGRLHLKWAEALWWSGDRKAAQRELTVASGLDLSTADRQALARVAARK